MTYRTIIFSVVTLLNILTFSSYGSNDTDNPESENISLSTTVQEYRFHLRIR